LYKGYLRWETALSNDQFGLKQGDIGKVVILALLRRLRVPDHMVELLDSLSAGFPQSLADRGQRRPKVSRFRDIIHAGNG
jgi:hypothetical protein